MSDTIDIAKRHTHAVVRMLLGRKMLKPGAALIAGGPVPMFKKIELARIANESRTDIVHLTFDDTADGYTMTGLHICAPRDNIVYSYSDCQLSLIGKRTIIVPPHGRGHFVLAPDELIHKPARPDGWERGIARATQRLREMVERGTVTSGQIQLNEIEPAD